MNARDPSMPPATTANASDVRARVSAEEWALRVDLAAAYRLVDQYGWTDMIYNHISARVPGPDHHFLLNPFGLRWDEVTASNLVKIDLEGTGLEKRLAFEFIPAEPGSRKPETTDDDDDEPETALADLAPRKALPGPKEKKEKPARPSGSVPGVPRKKDE